MAPSVECASEYPSGIVISNPASNTVSFFLESEIDSADGTPLFGDGGIIAPGESFRVASGGESANVEDATYRYVVRQSPRINGADSPTEPFTQVAAGTYVFDCAPSTTPQPGTAEVVTVAPSVECASEYPSGIVISNPASNTVSFFLESEIDSADGTPLFGDGGIIAPGESFRVASGGESANVEDATYRYVVRQSPRINGADSPTEPFTQVAAGTYVFDCAPSTTPQPGTAEVVTVAPSVECASEYPSGIVISNPASNTVSFFLESEIDSADGTPLFGDGGIIAPGESFRVASGGESANVEDATYRYVVRQSPRINGADSPTEPFTQVAAGTYVFDCAPSTTPQPGTAEVVTVAPTGSTNADVRAVTSSSSVGGLAVTGSDQARAMPLLFAGTTLLAVGVASLIRFKGRSNRYSGK